MFKTDSTIKVLIGKNVSRTGSVQISDPSNGTTYLADGEIVVLNTNSLDTTNVASQYITLVQRSGATAATADLNFSPRIKVSDIIRITKKAYAASAEQVSYIGYSGSLDTGSITTTDYNNYGLTLVYLQNKGLFSEQEDKRFYMYSSEASTTQYAVINDLTKQINTDAATYVSAVTVTGVALAAGYDFDNTTTLTNGSATVTVGTNLQYNTGTALAAGDFVRFGATATTATALTDGVYRVASIDSATQFTMDRPLEGPSGAPVTGSNYTQVIPSATGLASDWGAKLTGEALTYTTKGLFPWRKVAFNGQLKNFGTSTFTTATTTSLGNGTYQQVGDLEWFSLGGDGIRNNMWHPIPDGRTDVVVGTTYDIYTVEYLNTDDSKVISGNSPSRGLVYLAVYASAGQETQIEASLNANPGPGAWSI